MTDPTKRQIRVLDMRGRDGDYMETEVLVGTADELEQLVTDLERGGLVWAEWLQHGVTEVAEFRASHTELLEPAQERIKRERRAEADELAATVGELREAELLEQERQEARTRLQRDTASALAAYRNEVLATPMAVFDEGVQAQHEWPGYAGSEKPAAHAALRALVLPHADQPMRRADFDAAISAALDELFAQDPAVYRLARPLGDELRAELRTLTRAGDVRAASDVATRPEGHDR